MKKLVVWIDEIDKDAPRPGPESDEWVQCCDAEGDQLGYMSERQSLVQQEVRRQAAKIG